jgi:NodT family efflux transporter outer membrane factor (OMF) lipoprotein
MKKITIKLIGICILSPFLLTACMVGPNFYSPASPQTNKYTPGHSPKKTISSPGPGGKAQKFHYGLDIPVDWWRLFRSEELNYVIEKGLANSPNIKAAKAALLQAQENVYAQVGALLFPNVNAQFLVQREKFSAASFGAGSAGGSSSNTSTTVFSGSDTFNLFNPQFNISYTLDVWGGARRQIEALQGQVDYQGFTLEAAHITLVANIATTAITEASLRAQIAATHELIRLETRQVSILQKQFELGAVSRVDVLTLQTQLEQLRATLPPLEQNLAKTRHSLAVLTGDIPSESLLPKFELNRLHLPGQVPLSLPSFLVRQRPDIRASEALLHAASAQIGVATANLFPQFTINGYYGWEANKIKDLFTPASVVWSIAGQVTQPIFSGGSLRAQRRAAIAAYDQAFAKYRQTVLQGFQNVADSLKALQNDARTLQAQAAADDAARGALELTRKRYELGAINYIGLLIAQQQFQQTQIARIQARASRYLDTVALLQALGGGWWNRGCRDIPPVPKFVYLGP